MNYKFMRLMLFFDLPMLTDKDRREYVYTKLVINNVTSAAVKQRIRDNVPNDGIVELLEITENQFSKIEYLVGEEQQLVIDTVDRLVEL